MSSARIVVTGAAGFVGSHIVRLLRQRFPDAAVVPTTDVVPARDDEASWVIFNVTDRTAAERLLIDVRPTHVIHLAAVPTLAGVNRNLDRAWSINVNATVAMADAILTHAPDCTLIFASSAEVYGASAAHKECLDENTLLAPVSEYAASKAAADLALGALACRGLKVVRFRPFNHTGPGQTPDFVVPAFSDQIARIEAGRQAPVMEVGNLDAERDFLDVRDVAAAYASAVERSGQLPAGAIINLASGTPRRIGDILDHLLSLSTVKIEIRPDPARQRPNELRRYYGDARRAADWLGWKPKHTLEETLAAVLDFYRQRYR